MGADFLRSSSTSRDDAAHPDTVFHSIQYRDEKALLLVLKLLAGLREEPARKGINCKNTQDRGSRRLHGMRRATHHCRKGEQAPKRGFFGES